MDLRFSQFEVLTTTGSFFVSLLFVCVFVEASDIEQEVGIAAAEAVRQHSLYWASVEPSGLQIVLDGAAPDHASRIQAGLTAAGVPGVDRVDNQIDVIGQIGSCQSELDDQLARRQISFKRGKADLTDSSYAGLLALAGVVRSCTVRIEVACHTDGEGDEGINMKLSQRRASAIRRYLVQRGVDPQRLKAEGYGETQPIGDNATEDGRGRNERVEFRVIGGAV